MANQRKSAREQSVKMAFCGMTAGLSVAIMLLGGVIPAATYAVPILCGLALLPLLLEFGKTAAWTTFFAVAALALLLGFDKEAALFYLFIGYYPLVKWRLDAIRPKFKSVAAKAALFLCALGGMYGIMFLLFPMEAMVQEFREMGALLSLGFALMYLLTMLLYDWSLPRFVLVYANRIRPKFKFLNRK